MAKIIIIFYRILATWIPMANNRRGKAAEEREKCVPLRYRLVAVLGAAVGLLVSGLVLALLWFGVSGVLYVGRTDLMYVFWPSSVVLIGGWKTTALGIAITAYSVLTNCLMYAGVALLLRWGAGSTVKRLLPRCRASGTSRR